MYRTVPYRTVPYRTLYPGSLWSNIEIFKYPGTVPVSMNVPVVHTTSTVLYKYLLESSLAINRFFPAQPNSNPPPTVVLCSILPRLSTCRSSINTTKKPAKWEETCKEPLSPVVIRNNLNLQSTIILSAPNQLRTQNNQHHELQVASEERQVAAGSRGSRRKG